MPNVLSISRAAADAKLPLPWFNLGFAAVAIGGISWLALWFAVSGTGAGWLGASTLQQGKMQDN